MQSSLSSQSAPPATAPAAVACDHCGLPVPAGLVAPEQARQFCCAGCQTVHEALAACGLERYYALRDDDTRPARVTDRSYGELDDPGFLAVYGEPAPEGLASVPLLLENVHCTACVWLVEKLPALLDGVVSTRLDLGRAMCTVVWEPTRVPLSEIARRLDSLGYPVHPYRGVDRQAVRRRADRALLTRIAVAGAVAGNVMLLAIALYAGMFSDMGPGWEAFFRWLSLAVTIPAVVYSGSVFYRGALGALRARALHMDLPISLGITAGVVWGAVNTVRGVGEIYFDSVTMLIFFLLIGRWVQNRQQQKSATAAELLFALTPGVARRVEGDAIREVAVQSLVVGDVVELRAGETVPVDGVVLSGRSAINAALLSGESRPEEVGPGSAVCAGTINLGGLLRIEARATGEETRIGKLVQRIEEAARRRAPIVQLADRMAGVFVATALALAMVTLLVWLRAGADVALEHAIALLIVTCPCALGMATPLAMSVAIGRAARRGTLIKGGDALERLARPGTLLLDKTGTLTEGKVAVVEWHGLDCAAEVAAIEAASAHPLARALTEHGRRPGARLLASDVEELPSMGIIGRVDGETYLIGAPEHIAARTGGLGAFAQVVVAVADRAHTPVAIAVGEGASARIVAVAGLGDPLRHDARETIDALRAGGWRVAILSGDHQRVVDAVGAALGFEPAACRGGASPEDKLAAVQRAAADGPVVMVGDGVNDAAALAAATCGIAVHGSAEASLSAADVFIDGRGSAAAGLAPLRELFDGARATLGVIRRNLVFSLCYNLVGVSLAMTGLIHPLIAAVMMPLSSLTVVASSSRSPAFRPGPEEMP